MLVGRGSVALLIGLVVTSERRARYSRYIVAQLCDTLLHMAASEEAGGWVNPAWLWLRDQWLANVESSDLEEPRQLSDTMGAMRMPHTKRGYPAGTARALFSIHPFAMAMGMRDAPSSNEPVSRLPFGDTLVGSQPETSPLSA